uniref:Toll-like receptor 1 n=2 Tax=Crassostrea virginica TaxID=6565 RepID=A0A8B8BBN9_CRAVI|nr:toll-like receptor 1 [Crassostrea virginica]
MLFSFVFSFHIWGSFTRIESANPCTFSPYTDGCGNHGWLWNCSHRSLTKIPQVIPIKYKDYFLSLDLSWNNFREISISTFQNIQPNFSSHITGLNLQGNYITSIGNFSFQSLNRLCELDLSNCSLSKTELTTQAFVNLPYLKILRLHYNYFQAKGYPDVSLSKIFTLENLTIDVFDGFRFSSLFRDLKRLKNITFFTGKSRFYLRNFTFSGLSQSPISYLDLNFRFSVYCDVSEDIFCSFPVLKGVNIDFGGLCNFYSVLHSLKCLQNRSMEYIAAYENIPRIITKAVYLTKKNCQYLNKICCKRVNIRRNRIAKVLYNPLETVMGQCIEYLDISGNLIGHLEAKSSSEKKIKENPIISILLSKKFKVFDYSKNYIHRAPPSFPFKVSIFATNLTELYLMYNNLPCQNMTSLQLPALEILDISRNFCNEMSSRLLEFTLNLKRFSASGSELNFTGSLSDGTIFRGLKKLEEVDLSSNGIYVLPLTTFEDQKYSLKSLNLDSNGLSSVPVSHLKNLSVLYLRYNQLAFFSESGIRNAMSLSKATLFIKGNPISCECTHVSSLKWLRINQDKFGDLNETYCIDNKEMSITNFFQEASFVQFELRCQTKEWLIASSIMLFLVIVGVHVPIVIKRYRVHVDYIILRLRSRSRGVMRTRYSQSCQFDAFVSYAEEDYRLACLFYRVLHHRGLKISLPDKDFLPGLSKVEQMLQCIDDSQKVVFIVTEKFLENGWNSYTVQFVVTHAFHNNRERSIIVVIKDDIPIERMPRDLKFIWWSIVNIRWPKCVENMDAFWDQITAELLHNT